MPDKIEKIGQSIIQHGVENDRVYLMKLEKKDADNIVPVVEEIAQKNHYGKIFCKVPEWARDFFSGHQYRMEAHIPKFYQGKTHVYFMSKFLKPNRLRMNGDVKSKMRSFLNLAKSKADGYSVLNLQPEFKIKKLKDSNAAELAKLYDQVYDSYPFPITKIDYIKKTMKSNVDYFGVFFDKKLIAASSSEKDMDAANTEMTDFATLTGYRGLGLATALLQTMEPEMKKLKIKTYFTIARALSPGMNITFARSGYRYSGTLINNTQIAGHIEPMNVWYKLAV